MLSKLYAAAALAAAWPAAAQNIGMLPEQELAVQAYVEAHPLASIELPLFEVTLGNDVPEVIELHAVGVAGATYEYLCVNGYTVVVEPNSRKIVKILD